MSFFNIDDDAPNHPKHRALIDRGLDGDLKALAAGYLWTLMGAHLRSAFTDGVVTKRDLYRVMPGPLVEELPAYLVEVGLWHDHDTCCEKCKRPKPGEWVYHDWAQWSQRTGDQDRLRRALQTERKDSDLHDAMWERDRLPRARAGDVETALCVYCRRLLRRDTRKGPLRPEMDHVFARPFGLDGVAIACQECNRSKGNRSASKAGMNFHPTPPHAAAMARRAKDRSHPGEGFADLLEQAWATPPAPGETVPDVGVRNSHAEALEEPVDAGWWEPSQPEDDGCSVPNSGQEGAQEPRWRAVGAGVHAGTSAPADASQDAQEAAPMPDPASASASDDAQEPGGSSRARTRTGPRADARAADALPPVRAGQGKAGPGEEGHGKPGQGRSGQGTARPGRRRRGKRKRKPQPTCPAHGDRLPCRLCQEGEPS